jgi:hypothetical protein
MPWRSTTGKHDSRTAVDVDVLANDSDADGDTLSVAFVTQPANGTASINGGGVRYVPKAGFAGTDSFEYTATDGAAFATAVVRITVTLPNTAPTAVLTITPGTIEIGSTTRLDFSNSSDPDPGDEL